MNNAKLYSAANYLMRRDVTALLHKYMPRLRWNWDEESVLDVGSGPGDVTADVLLPLLPESVRRVVGADVSPAMVRHAASAHAHLLPRLRFVQADIAAADLRASPLRAEAGERGFSKIFTFHCLNWVPDQNTSLSNLYQLLRPGGEVLAMVVIACPIFDSHVRMLKNSTWLPYMQDAYEFISPYYKKSDPVGAFSTMSREIGFDVQECHMLEQVHDYSMEYFSDLFKSVSPFIDRIPDNMKANFIHDALREAHLEPISEENGQKQVCRYRCSDMIAHLVKN